MFKKIILISLFCLFLLRPIPLFALQIDNQSVTQQNQSTEENQLNILQQLLKAVVDFLGFLIYGTNYISKIYEPPATYNTSEISNDYSSKFNDYSSRAMPESVRMRRKGVYFYEVVSNGDKYQNLEIKGVETPENDKENCPHNISILDIVCFYSQKYQDGQLSDKILYTRESGNNPIDYPPLNCNQLNNPDICYLNAYRNFQDIPQGDFYGKEGNPAAIASTQFNESIRTLIPDNRQGENAPSNNDTREKVKTLIEDSDKQEEAMLLNLITENVHDDIICDDNANINRANLRNTFKCQFTPEYQKGDTDCGLGDNNGGPADCGKEDEQWVRNGPGISQHGARGLSLYGYNYFQIWQKYLGEDIEIRTVKGNDENIITVILVEDMDLDGNGLDNDPNCSSIVSHGEASYYNRADLEAGTGGVYSDGAPCVYIEDTSSQPVVEPDSDPDNPPPPPPKKYKVKPRPDIEKEKYKDKCFSAVTLPIKNYLLGIAEVPFMWNIEALKALVIAFRQEVAGRQFVKSDNSTSVFQCKRIIQNRSLGPSENPGGDFAPNVTNQKAAVQLTKDEFIYNKNTNNPHHEVVHYTAFCGPGHSNPAFNGLEYELLSRGFRLTGGNLNGICFEGLYPLINSRYDGRGGTLGVTSDSSTETNNSRIPSPRSKTVTASQNGNLYYFNDKTQQSPIRENYDLIDVDKGKWLATFQNQTNCQLDSRVFPALTSLTEKLKQDLPETSLIPKNCYRSYETQTELWFQGLAKYKDTYTNLIWHSYPGTSIHQTGRVIDFYDQNGQLDSSSPTYQWLLKNGSTYGFYHYKLEPWHWEYNP